MSGPSSIWEHNLSILNTNPLELRFRILCYREVPRFVWDCSLFGPYSLTLSTNRQISSKSINNSIQSKEEQMSNRFHEKSVVPVEHSFVALVIFWDKHFAILFHIFPHFLIRRELWILNNYKIHHHH